MTRPMGHNGPRGFKKYDYKRKGSPILKKCMPIEYEKIFKNVLGFAN
jgi:hypothetical protein